MLRQPYILLTIAWTVAFGLPCDTTWSQLQVASFGPAANKLAVPVTAPIRIEFDRAIDPTTVNMSTIGTFGRWSGTATGSFSFTDANHTILFQPDDPFAAGELVSVSLSDGLLAADATPLRAGGYSSQFWTRSQHVSGLVHNPIAQLTTGSPSRPYGGIATDLNNDGWLDITSVNEDTADLRVFMNQANGSGGFAAYTQPTYSVGNRASPSESADFNGDGNADITVANINDNTISVLLGNGDGSFASQQTIPVGSTPRGITVLDVDGDGDVDIVNTNQSSGNMSLHFNNGAGIFGVPTTLDANMSGEWSLGSGDMNQDGLLDLIVASGVAQRIQVLTSNGDGTFTQQPFQSTGGRSWQMAVGDVNGDGLLDVSSANANNNNGSILLGNGDGTFQSPAVYNVAAMGSGSNEFPLATDLGDLDGDGDLDWITSSFNGEFVVMLNDGAGQFQFFAELDAPVAASCSLLFDFDNDGDLDLGLFDELHNSITLSRNDGNHVADGDFDADGTLDGLDIDSLVAQLAMATDNLVYDLTGDGLLNNDDLDRWLMLGGATNLASGNPYLPGDANLDGTVDGQDYIAWNANKFTATAAWSAGDFDADGLTDGSDFIIWNQHKFTSADAVVVPEPAAMVLFIGGFVLAFLRQAGCEWAS